MKHPQVPTQKLSDFIAVRRFLKSTQNYKNRIFWRLFLLYLKKNSKTNRNNEIVPLQTGKNSEFAWSLLLRFFTEPFNHPETAFWVSQAVRANTGTSNGTMIGIGAIPRRLWDPFQLAELHGYNKWG